jgi:hypothetical protein
MDNTCNPVVISLEKLSPISNDKVFLLEEILSSNVKSLFYPYPIYCIGKCPNYFGQLQFYDHKNHLPKFYFFKTKNTSKLHSELLLYNQIAQREYECINFKKSEEIKNQYSNVQKKIYSADAELRSIHYIRNLVQKNLDQEE